MTPLQWDTMEPTQAGLWSCPPVVTHSEHLRWYASGTIRGIQRQVVVQLRGYCPGYRERNGMEAGKLLGFGGLLMAVQYGIRASCRT